MSATMDSTSAGTFVFLRHNARTVQPVCARCRTNTDPRTPPAPVTSARGGVTGTRKSVSGSVGPFLTPHVCMLKSETFGIIISRTPFRILFRRGTDYPAWFRERGGAVLATTIDSTKHQLRELPPFLTIDTASFIPGLKAHEIEEIQHPMHAVRSERSRSRPEIHHDG